MEWGPRRANAGRWLRRSPLVRFVLLLCVAGFAALFYYAYFADPIQIPGVTPQPAFLNSSIGNLDIHATGRLKQGLVPLSVSGSIFDPSISRLTLVTGPPGGAVLSQVQPNCCAISGMTFVGTAQLGSAESPVTGTSVVPFRLVSSDGNTSEAAGSLAVNVDSFPGGSPVAYMIIAGLSLLATLIAIAQVVFPPERQAAAGPPSPGRRPGPRPAPAPGAQVYRPPHPRQPRHEEKKSQ